MGSSPPVAAELSASSPVSRSAWTATSRAPLRRGTPNSAASRDPEATPATTSAAKASQASSGTWRQCDAVAVGNACTPAAITSPRAGAPPRAAASVSAGGTNRPRPSTITASTTGDATLSAASGPAGPAPARSLTLGHGEHDPPHPDEHHREHDQVGHRHRGPSAVDGGLEDDQLAQERPERRRAGDREKPRDPQHAGDRQPPGDAAYRAGRLALVGGEDVAGEEEQHRPW